MLIEAAESNITPDHHTKLLAHARLYGREKGIDAALQKWNIDVILVPADSLFNEFVSAAGMLSSMKPIKLIEEHSYTQSRLSIRDDATGVPRL